jgi:hypothetical protein
LTPAFVLSEGVNREHLVVGDGRPPSAGLATYRTSKPVVALPPNSTGHYLRRPRCHVGMTAKKKKPRKTVSRPFGATEFLAGAELGIRP